MDVQPYKPTPPRSDPRKCRLSVVEYVYHQQLGQSPKAIEHRWCRNLESDEQQYVRVFQATEEWKNLDTGFLEDNVGHLILVNEEGQSPSVQLSPEEKQEVAARKVELGLRLTMPESLEQWVVPFATVVPGESCRLTPSNIGNYCIRALAGNPRCTLTLIPR